ncbi:Telomere_reg-2 domain-containing protein [Caenorhabditis elegans]|uniref:Telomere_reg-2 domain-containing protein n=1 Tax=Caenorhabditis elegans TaxID=6239 RepID=O01756_CAEEL|nr:Telomere_reg-2 domain-containing protein [Caenorhabditis elegans]CCD65449.1 Telomere_reg-2 domain-containing protein [Caenorhabditis elegans]|eukprot:NP_491573.2 Uncharacterized protein CELE_F55A12.5 [Caenorhabditis elegans]
MVLNDSFSALFSSPASLKKANDSFNESFGDKNTLSPSTIFRSLQKEHDQISSVLRSHPPTTAQYQNSLNELVSLYERAEDQSTFGLQKLVLSVFLKLAANILSVLGKPNHQPTLYKLSQLLASSIVPDLSPEHEIEEIHMQQWADRVVIECSIHLAKFTNYRIDLAFNIDSIVDDLVLASGRFQFVKSSIFEAARDIVSSEQMDLNAIITPESKFSLSNLGDEQTLRLLLWLYLFQKSMLKSEFLSSLFSNLPSTLNAQEYMKSAECSMLDVKLYIVTLSTVASTTTESGMTMKSAPVVASQLSLTKRQKDCWKAIVDACAGHSRKTVAALSRLRTSQLVEAVRLISDSSEDVQVLFEAWKHCLQPSAAHDDNVHEAIQVVTEKYRTKINSLLCYGPFYSTAPVSSMKQSTVTRRDMKALFPLPFDYEYINTTESEHIGTIINSLEGYSNVEASEEAEEDDEDILCASNDFSFRDEDIFHSFDTAPDNLSSADNSMFFSPLKHNRDSMLPSAVSQLIRDESILNSSHISTKSVILTPTRASYIPGTVQTSELSFERHQNVAISTPSKKESFDSSDEDEEDDEMEAALLKSAQRHEKSILAQKTPEKLAPKVATPMKDAQTETDDAVLSSGESSVVTVKYTPKMDVQKKKVEIPVISSESEEEEYEEEDEYEEYEDDEDEDEYYEEEEENEVEDDDFLTETQLEELMEQIILQTSVMFRDQRMKKFGLEKEMIKFDGATDEEILLQAEQKLAKITETLKTTSNKLQNFCTPSSSSVKTHQPLQAMPSAVSKLEKSVDHDSKKCLGCQSDEVQEAALRRLEQMANDWDAEGNDYLYK